MLLLEWIDMRLVGPCRDSTPVAGRSFIAAARACVVAQWASCGVEGALARAARPAARAMRPSWWTVRSKERAARSS
jgi:hypothetical protein